MHLQVDHLVAHAGKLEGLGRLSTAGAEHHRVLRHRAVRSRHGEQGRRQATRPRRACAGWGCLASRCTCARRTAESHRCRDAHRSGAAAARSASIPCFSRAMMLLRCVTAFWSASSSCRHESRLTSAQKRTWSASKECERSGKPNVLSASKRAAPFLDRCIAPSATKKITRGWAGTLTRKVRRHTMRLTARTTSRAGCLPPASRQLHGLQLLVIRRWNQFWRIRSTVLR